MNTNYPVLMECLEGLINTKRFFDAEQLLADARAYCRATPPPGDVWVLVAEGMRDRMRAEGVEPTTRTLGNRLAAEKMYPAATYPILKDVLA